MIKETIKVGIIGAGYMAREHIRAFQSLPEVKVTGIYSRTFSRAEALALEFGIDAVCDSIDILFERAQADLIVVAVPELSMREVCCEIFKYPWICLLEKPAGYNIADAEEIALVAKQCSANVFVALNRRHYSSTQVVLCDLASHSQMGRRLIHVYDQQDPIKARQAGQPELVVKNWMYANAIHLIDYFYLLGRGEIIAVEPIIRWNADNPDFVMAKIQYASGDIGVYEAIWNAPGPWAVTVSTPEKRWELRPLENAAFQSYGSRQLESVPLDLSDEQFKPGLYIQAKEAVKVVKQLPHALPSLEESLKSMYLVQAIYT